MAMAAQLEETLEHLSGVDSPSIPVLSVYLNLAPGQREKRSVSPRLRSLLDPIEKHAASGDLDHDASTSLRTDIEKVLAMAPWFEDSVGHAAAVFACDAVGLEEKVTMPRRAWDCAIAGPAPYLRPLQAVLDGFRKLAAVVLDSRTAEIYLLHMGEILHQETIEAEELRKKNLSGWYGLEEYRHRQHAEEARYRLFREVAERLRDLRKAHGIEWIFAGGQREVTSALIPFIDPATRGLTSSFVIDLHTLTPAVLKTSVTDLERQLQQEEESRLVEQVRALAEAGGLGAVGVDRVLKAAHRNAISRLLLATTTTMPGSVCVRCGALSRPTPVCSECRGHTEAVPDLFEALSRAVTEAGGSVDHLMSPAHLGDDLTAALLRFSPW